MELIHNFKDGFVGLFFGVRRSGKTTVIVQFMNDFLIERFGYDNIYLIYPQLFTPESQYSVLGLKKDNCSDTYDENVLKRLYEIQLERVLDGTDKQVLVILDDCISEENFNRRGTTSILATIAADGRHKKFSLIVSSQYYSAFNTVLRANCDIAFIWQSHGEAFDHACKVFRPTDKKSFKKILLSLKREHSFLYIDYVRRCIWRYEPNIFTFVKLLNFGFDEDEDEEKDDNAIEEIEDGEEDEETAVSLK